MPDRFIVGALFPTSDLPFYKKPAARVRVTVTTDPFDTFSYYRRTYGAFIPLTAYLVHPDIELDFLKGLQLSDTNTIQRAADLLHRLPIHPPMAAPMWEIIHQLRELGVSLLSEWFDAVAKATVPQFN